MIEWGGYKYDEATRRIKAPNEAWLVPADGLALTAFLKSNGDILTSERLMQEMKTTSKNSMKETLSRLREAGIRIRSRYGMGWSLLPVAGREAAKEKVAAYLISQFEAGPSHARIAARVIADMLGD